MDNDEHDDVILKWYLNNKIIYQWIPSSKPRVCNHSNVLDMNNGQALNVTHFCFQGVGDMKGRINLDYVKGKHKWDRHRALFLRMPTTEMTGDYTCKVSTLQNDVTATKRMTVFGKTFQHQNAFILLLDRITVDLIVRGQYKGYYDIDMMGNCAVHISQAY